jgi:hypothetical protein
MAKASINGPLSIAMLVYQRVCIYIYYIYIYIIYICVFIVYIVCIYIFPMKSICNRHLHPGAVPRGFHGWTPLPSVEHAEETRPRRGGVSCAKAMGIMRRCFDVHSIDLYTKTIIIQCFFTCILSCIII